MTTILFIAMYKHIDSATAEREVKIDDGGLYYLYVACRAGELIIQTVWTCVQWGYLSSFVDICMLCVES